MYTNAKRLVITATLVGAASTAAAILPASSSGMSVRQSGSTTSSPTTRSWTPNDCIKLNGGDFNACNVGNSGRGDLPYRPVDTSGSVSAVRLPKQFVRVL
jgi:roadblock/LC7 domain-containing protein